MISASEKVFMQFLADPFVEALPMDGEANGNLGEFKEVVDGRIVETTTKISAQRSAFMSHYWLQ